MKLLKLLFFTVVAMAFPLENALSQFVFEDKYPVELRFANENSLMNLNFKNLEVNNDIRLSQQFKVANCNIYLTMDTLYNLNVWENKNNDYDSWIPEKTVVVLLFLFDSNDNKWVGGDFDNVILGTAMICKLNNMYGSKKYGKWPKFKRELNENDVVKICVYNKSKMEVSNFSYSAGAVAKLKMPE